MIWLTDNLTNNQLNSEAFQIVKPKPKRLKNKRALDGIKYFLISYWVTCFCIVGCFIQIFLLTRNYFSKNVNYQVLSINSVNITVPEVIICTPIHTVLDYGKLVTEKSSLFNNSCLNSSAVDKCVLDKFNVLYLDYLLRENFDITAIYPYLIKSSQLFISIYIHGEPNLLENGVCKTKDYMAYPNVCYKIICTEKLANGVSKKIRVRRYIVGFIPLYESLITIHLNNSLLVNRTKSITVFLNSMDYPRRENDFDYGQSFSHDADDPLIVHFKFSIQRTISLPSPYPTDCHKHDHDRLMSYCLNNASISLFNSPFPRRIISLQKGYNFKLIPDMSKMDKIGLIAQVCLRRHPNPNCESEMLTIHKMGEEKSDVPTFSKMIVIAIHSPDEPDLHFFVTPAMTASECIIMIFSILGFWFGFDLYHDANRVSSLLIRLVDRCTNKVKVNKASNPNYRAIKPKLEPMIKSFELQRSEKWFTIRSNY